MTEAGWVFDKDKVRELTTISDREGDSSVSRYLQDIAETELGRALLQAAETTDINIAFEEDLPTFGLYIPPESTVDGTPLILLDKALEHSRWNKAEAARDPFAVYILAHELYHALQDRVGLIVPYEQYGVRYSFSVRLKDEDFITAHNAMEGACDAIGLMVLFQRRMLGDRADKRFVAERNVFDGEMKEADAVKDIRNSLWAANEFIQDKGLSRAQRRNFCLAWGYKTAELSPLCREFNKEASEKILGRLRENADYLALEDVQLQSGYQDALVSLLDDNVLAMYDTALMQEFLCDFLPQLAREIELGIEKHDKWKKGLKKVSAPHPS